MESLTLQPIARVDGTINLPGSKSVSNRALLLAALAHGKTVLTNLLDSDDVRLRRNAFAALSYTLFSRSYALGRLSVTAVHYTQKVPWLFLENAGTQCRPLAVALCLAGSILC